MAVRSGGEGKVRVRKGSGEVEAVDVPPAV